LYNCAVCAG